MNKKEIEKLLLELNEQLRGMGIRAEIAIYGGAVMCLVLNARESTHDIDAIFAPKEYMNIAIKNVGEKYSLDAGWFNDAVKGFVSIKNDIYLFERLSHLDIYVTKPRYLFAMKAMSCRLDNEHELNDIRFLVNYLGLQNVDQAYNLILEYFPESRVLPKTRYMLMEIFQGG